MLALQTVSYLLLTYFQLSQSTFTPTTPFPEGRAEYLVVMDNVTDEAVKIHNTWLYKEMESRPLAQIKKNFDMSHEGFVAYHGNFSQEMANLIAARPNVEYMEVNGKVSINAAAMSSDNLDIEALFSQFFPGLFPSRRGSPGRGSPEGDAPGSDAPGSDAPGSDAPGSDAPGSDAPGSDAPGGDATPVSPTTPASASKTSTTQSSVKNYGLTMISESKGKTYAYPSNGGEGVVVYVIDTGINVDHEDFAGGRAEMLANFVDGEDNTDRAGHGTHVSGIVGGAISGIAKKVKIYGIKVLGADGSGDSSGVIAGIEKAVQHHKGRGAGAKSVINMSLGSHAGENGGTARAIKAAAKAGIHVAVAAGNDHADACDGAPASPKDAFVVASVGKSKEPSDFSNLGSCVNINAPGEKIKSADFQQNDGFVSMSGTSMASPHVAGVLALTLAEKDGSPSEIRQLLIQNAEASVQGARDGTTDKLISTKFLLKGLGGDDATPAAGDTPTTTPTAGDATTTPTTGDTPTATPKHRRRHHHHQ